MSFSSQIDLFISLPNRWTSGNGNSSSIHITFSLSVEFPVQEECVDIATVNNCTVSSDIDTLLGLAIHLTKISGICCPDLSVESNFIGLSALSLMAVSQAHLDYLFICSVP